MVSAHRYTATSDEDLVGTSQINVSVCTFARPVYFPCTKIK
jgi:hypothetical protein